MLSGYTVIGHRCDGRTRGRRKRTGVQTLRHGPRRCHIELVSSAWPNGNDDDGLFMTAYRNWTLTRPWDVHRCAEVTTHRMILPEYLNCEGRLAEDLLDQTLLDQVLNIERDLSERVRCKIGNCIIIEMSEEGSFRVLDCETID